MPSAAIGAAAAIGGSLISSRAQSKASKRMADASRRLSTTLGPFSGSGGLGVRTSFDPSNNATNIGVGQLGFSQDRLRQLVEHNLQKGPAAFGEAQATTNRLNQLTQQISDPSHNQLLDQLQSNALQLGQDEAQSLEAARQGFQPQLQNQAFTGAQQSLMDVGGADAARQRTLTNLRAQARPGQERAVDSTLTNLFSTGRLGTTGGANIVGRLAEAQNKQDLGFQLAANQEGRNFQNNAMSMAQRQAQLGSSLRQQQEGLLNSAFSRFGQTQNLTASLDNTRTNRRFRTQGLQAGMLQQLFGQQTSIPQLKQQADRNNLNMALAGLQGISGIQGMGLRNFNASLAASQAAANARIGAGSNVAAAMRNPNFGVNSAQVGLGNALVQNAGNIGNFLGGLFSSQGSQQPRFAPLNQNAAAARGV